MLTVFLAVLCSLMMLAGLAGIILPFIPGVPLAWLGLFIYAIGTGFERISIFTTVVFFILTLLTLVLDLISPMLGAKKYRASKWGIIGATLGLPAGILFLGFWGIILGPFIGALLGELISRRKGSLAFKSAFGTVIGFLAGTLVKIVIVLIMMGFFIASWF
ncbi:MAG TPA: DUF456 domain-containing protein [Dehalococcoidales bacterium]|nr:DUF456 domain-containing protein [Dehalococcoidales bacterium]